MSILDAKGTVAAATTPPKDIARNKSKDKGTDTRKKGSKCLMRNHCMHKEENCYFDHPEKAPQGWKDRRKEKEKEKEKESNPNTEQPSSAPLQLTLGIVSGTALSTRRSSVYIDSMSDTHIVNDIAMLHDVASCKLPITGISGSTGLTHKGTLLV